MVEFVEYWGHDAEGYKRVSFHLMSSRSELGEEIILVSEDKCWLIRVTNCRAGCKYRWRYSKPNKNLLYHGGGKVIKCIGPSDILPMLIEAECAAP